jgi:hypothetical protein
MIEVVKAKGAIRKPDVLENIMSNVISQSTGPKTQTGKAVSSKNAIKAGIFSKGYLSWEDQEAKQAELMVLAKEWNVTGPSGLHFLRDIEQANLAQERLMYAECMAVEGAMQSAQVGDQFALRANIDIKLSHLLPSWYFLEDDGGHKAQALYLNQVYEQASELKSRYSDQLVAQAKIRHPQLYEYVLEGYQANSSFVMILAKEYKQNTPTLNLGQLMNSLAEGFRFHLLWAQDPKRYQIIVDGLRAEKMMQVLDFDKSNRYLTNFQNRRIRALQGLETLERREHTKQQMANAIEHSGHHSEGSHSLVTQVPVNNVVLDSASIKDSREKSAEQGR